MGLKKEDFEIILEDEKVDEEMVESRNRALFSQDASRGGILAKCLIFTLLNEPVSTTELTKIINSRYKTDVDRAMVYRAVQKLIEKHIMATTTTGTILHLQEGERTDMHKKILFKYFEFLSKIPEGFKQNFQNVNYYWVSNGYGIKYVNWCCDLLKIKCKIK